jgi:hypothetical protein
MSIDPRVSPALRPLPADEKKYFKFQTLVLPGLRQPVNPEASAHALLH